MRSFYTCVSLGQIFSLEKVLKAGFEIEESLLRRMYGPNGWVSYPTSREEFSQILKSESGLNPYA